MYAHLRLPPLSALPERFAGPANTPKRVRRLRFAPSVGYCKSSLSPVGKRFLPVKEINAGQSFCLSVQTTAISGPAPSAVSFVKTLS